MPRRHLFVLLWLLTFGSSTPVFGQSVLERVVGPTPTNEPLTLWQLDGGNIGSLALASRVPMGIELIEVPFQHKWSIPATGRKVRDVLEALVAAEPGYTWEENDGVIVIHPVVPINDARNKLNIRIPRFQLADVHSGGALDALAALFGIPVPPPGPGDTKRFSVDVQDNSTIRDALNAVVRAHGTLAWAYSYTRSADPENFADGHMFALAVANRYELPASLAFMIGSGGAGMGVPRDARIGRVPAPPIGAVTAVADPPSILERIVGPGRDGLPLSIPFLPSMVGALAQASHTPIGIETTAMERGILQTYPPITVTGMRLRDALSALAGTDPRYEWREMDGVIVFRPVQAWLDGSDPLFLPVKPVQLHRASLSAVFDVIRSALGASPPTRSLIADSRRISIDIPGGSALDLLNAAAKSHGQLWWHFEEMSKSDQRTFGGLRYRLNVFIFGASGYGFLVP